MKMTQKKNKEQILHLGHLVLFIKEKLILKSSTRSTLLTEC